ncbi:hypothetical protein Mapa_006450 [Marchantia paleacea]|nr:hypothetical protein Mapa_006450 [Marchantia paleacea]
MGSEELDMVGGGPSQIVDIGLSSLSGRSVQSDQYSRNMPGPKRSEPAKKQRPGEGFGDYSDAGKYLGRDRPGFLQNAERDYREGGEGFHLEHRVQKESGGENDERKNVYGGNQLGGMGVGRDQDQWGGGDRDGVGGEGDFRDMGLRGEGSEVSQSEGTEGEDEDDADLEGEGEEGTVGDRSRESVLGDRAISHPQMASLEGRMRQESMMASRGVEGFQRTGSDRDRVMKAPTSASPPFNMYLQSTGLPFINFQQASPSGAHLATHVEANSAQNGGVGGGVGSAMSGGYGMREGGISRDSYAKSLAARECAMGSSMHEQQSQGHLHESLQSSEDNYYTSLLNSTGSNNSSAPKGQDIGNDVGGGQKRNARMMESPSSAEPSLRRILSDPITGQLMDDASIFGCGHSFGNAGLARVMETNVCITCGASVRATSMAPNYALRAAVQAYKREEENSIPKLSKRRRDRPEQDQGTPVEQQPSSDTSRSKGVQFPFSVSDRVLIKGNKRTPERFVGREAVITNQCLNGWYLVRTLDNGESVRLQYRSLQKLGGQPSPNASHYAPGPGWL